MNLRIILDGTEVCVMELEVQHENQTIILWLRSGCRTDLSLLYEMPHIGLLFCGDCGQSDVLHEL